MSDRLAAYREFLAAKIRIEENSGFALEPSDIHDNSRRETRRLRIALFEARQKEDRAYDLFKEAQDRKSQLVLEDD